jgi:endonuclease YncB( thermonuclease family)
MIIFLILFLLASPAHAQEQMYIYKALKITDGDTIKLDVSKESPLVKKLGLSVRIKGIDTPEKAPRAKCKKESELGQQATKFTTELVGNKELLLSEIEWDKYGGRIVANVKVGGVGIAQELLKKGLARVYNGEKKKSWCD